MTISTQRDGQFGLRWHATKPSGDSSYQKALKLTCTIVLLGIDGSIYRCQVLESDCSVQTITNLIIESSSKAESEPFPFRLVEHVLLRPKVHIGSIEE